MPKNNELNWIAMGVVVTLLVGAGSIVATVFGQDIRTALLGRSGPTPEEIKRVVEAFKGAQLNAGKAPLETPLPPDCCTPDSLLRANFDVLRAELQHKGLHYSPKARVIAVQIGSVTPNRDGSTEASVKTVTERPLLNAQNKPVTGPAQYVETGRWTFRTEKGRLLLVSITSH